MIPSDRPFLQPEQIRPFIDAVHGTKYEIPALLALSSLRRSEILGLRWENVDLEHRVIYVRGAVVYDEHNRLTAKAENKNATSNRRVPIMIDALFDALQVARQPDGYLVPMLPDGVLRGINRICEAHDLPRVGIHGLRHSFVSLAYHLGVPEKIVMDIGGWADYQTMRRIYTHLAKSDLRRYTDELSSFFSSGSPSSP